MSNCYPSFSPVLSSNFIPLIYSPTLFPYFIFRQVCFYYALHSRMCPYCTLVSYLPLFLLMSHTSAILGIFLKIVSKILVQHAPNTHLWQVLSHSSMLHRTPPCLHNIFGGFFCCHDFHCYLFLCSQNSLYDLCS
jgi:hypothetical protein